MPTVNTGRIITVTYTSGVRGLTFSLEGFISNITCFFLSFWSLYFLDLCVCFLFPSFFTSSSSSCYCSSSSSFFEEVLLLAFFFFVFLFVVYYFYSSSSSSYLLHLCLHHLLVFLPIVIPFPFSSNSA